jgi:hypothetical protein
VDAGSLGLIVVSAGALIGLVWFLIRFRRIRDRQPPPSPAHAPPATAQAPALHEGQALLVPLPNQRNEALLLGSESALQALEDSGLTKRPRTGPPGPLPQLVRTMVGGGGMEATRRTQTGIDQGRIVALSNETMEQLRKNKQAYDKAGKALGLVRGKKGITHIMRFERAGAKAAVASNAATLAMTMALSQQLAEMEKLLKEIQDTLSKLVADVDRKRLAGAVATNHELESIARAIERRGEITEADWDRIASLSLPVTTNTIEADFKFAEMLERLPDGLNRGERVDELERLFGKEKLEYWLAVRVQTELAQTRRDLLHLYWEQVRHPDTAHQLATETKLSIETRQERLDQVGQLLTALADPSRRTFTDPVRLISRHRLEKDQKVVAELLERHKQAFAGSGQGEYAVIEGEADEVLLLEAGAGNVQAQP